MFNGKSLIHCGGILSNVYKALYLTPYQNIFRNPVHPSTFATASSNGQVGLWNLATSLEGPITGLQGITVEDSGGDNQKPRGINRLKWSLDGRRLAVACSDTLHVLGMNEEVWKPKGGEANKLMNNLQSRGLLEEGEE
jgi:dynein intermediate chain, cytosolic